MSVSDCVFCKIASGQIPARLVFEDEEFVAFHDLKPQAPVHVLLIPKAHFSTLLEVQDAGLLGRALLAVSETARRLNVAEEGFRTVINCGDNGGQTVYHLHFHILGGRFLQWPPG
jgi:histidine triad (HIT) family protein